MELRDVVRSGVGYERQWAIYAESCKPNAEARIGRTLFENGGVLDGKEYICDGVLLNDLLAEWLDGGEPEDLDVDEFIEYCLCDADA